ncbi:hypothetical protein BDV23DRAFT_177204 [Aspergillus alliaceus]|uniref:Uncharacterized protein n=1 Tax=Petromyces alliaceus TaxID=209559 RepID=A0A5N7BR02_PETAA|nr:hypothetical protein BDV23DRAFT_177204 [Aspergillus alliaceus]
MSPNDQVPADTVKPDAGQLTREGTGLTVNTEYIGMLLELDTIHWLYNVLASAANWALLAGYLIIPGTFTTLQKSSAFENTMDSTFQAKAILSSVQNPPLAAIACTFFFTGLISMLCLYRRWAGNYIWVINCLFLPTLLNAGAGLLTSLISIYTAKSGDWSIMALLTVITTGLSSVISFSLTIYFKFWKLKLVQDEHERQVEAGLELVYPTPRKGV